jgi:hypothetical protein
VGVWVGFSSEVEKQGLGAIAILRGFVPHVQALGDCQLRKVTHNGAVAP